MQCLWLPRAVHILFLVLWHVDHLHIAATVVETPLPYGQLRHKPTPRGYVAFQCHEAIKIDGVPDEACWKAAAFTEDFVDIVGPGVKPWYQTHAKILWDKQNLYIAAELEDPHVFADETLHDSIIFQDNDFEVFIDPDQDNWMYYELEVNARGQVWDLLLIRPYRNGGPPVMDWETIAPAVPTATSGPTGWRPMSLGVSVQGSINAASGSTGWTLEMALPWSILQQAANRNVPPASGDRWRINFSRVHWNVSWSDEQQRYIKVPADQPGYNWVWTPQWQVQMHQPETWGYLHFEETPVHASSGADGSAAKFTPDELWPARALLMDVYYAQTLCWQEQRRFCRSLAECSTWVDFSDVEATVHVETTKVSFVASTKVRLSDGSCMVVMVDQLSRIVQTPEGPQGALPELNPFEGSSYWPKPKPVVEGGLDMHCAGMECRQQAA